jgi:hypothetical protein
MTKGLSPTTGNMGKREISWNVRPTTLSFLEVLERTWIHIKEGQSEMQKW